MTIGRRIRKSKVIIRTDKKYANYLSKHLQKEHPKTKGKVVVK